MRKICRLLLGIGLSLGSFTAGYPQTRDSLYLHYGNLSTLAGRGKACDKSSNAWKPKFEGAKAVDVDLSRPHFAMADKEGNVYIADKDAHAIRKVDKMGIITTVAGTGSAGFNGDGLGTKVQLNSPNGLWVHPGGDVYILDLGNNRIRLLSRDGSVLTVLEDPEGIAFGRGLWVDERDMAIYYCSKTRIRKWARSSGLSTFSEGFSDLGNITMDPWHNLVATDRGGNRVYRLDEKGNKTVIAGNGMTEGKTDGLPATGAELAGVRAVWFFENGSYLLACHEGSKVWFVDIDGIVSEFLDGKKESHGGDGEHFRSPGNKVSEVRGISIDHQGNILICESDCGFVRKIAWQKGTR